MLKLAIVLRFQHRISDTEVEDLSDLQCASNLVSDSSGQEPWTRTLDWRLNVEFGSKREPRF